VQGKGPTVPVQVVVCPVQVTLAGQVVIVETVVTVEVPYVVDRMLALTGGGDGGAATVVEGEEEPDDEGNGLLVMIVKEGT